VIFARRPVLHYTRELTEHWNITVGIEDPNVQIDTTADPRAASGRTRPTAVQHPLGADRSGT
jgi:hypothetical protein